ncbi:unnamed protein product [Sphagnum jensenii]|uniref:Uncharacterized protein n=1 Tax=Sphagnum jensenii TaxID=128206 RepID=A0ABP0WD83_9BRYO
MSRYMTELFYGETPEPMWVTNSLRQQWGDHHPRYSGRGFYRRQSDFDPYTRAFLQPDVQLKVPVLYFEDFARIKDALAVEGVYNVICDIPLQTVTVSSDLPPQAIVSLVRQVCVNAHIVNYIDPHSTSSATYRTYPANPPFSLPQQSGHRYDNSWGHSNYYTPAYESAYRGRAHYPHEFQQTQYLPYRYH